MPNILLAPWKCDDQRPPRECPPVGRGGRWEDSLHLLQEFTLQMIVRIMEGADLPTVHAWVCREGWRPADADIASYFAADPRGMFVGVEPASGEMIGVIGTMRWGCKYGHIGLFIVAESRRGNGFGKQLWAHAIKVISPLPLSAHCLLFPPLFPPLSFFTLSHPLISSLSSSHPLILSLILSALSLLLFSLTNTYTERRFSLALAGPSGSRERGPRRRHVQGPHVREVWLLGGIRSDTLSRSVSPFLGARYPVDSGIVVAQPHAWSSTEVVAAGLPTNHPGIQHPAVGRGAGTKHRPVLLLRKENSHRDPPLLLVCRLQLPSNRCSRPSLRDSPLTWASPCTTWGTFWS